MDLIKNLSKEELRNFKLYLRRVYANKEDNRLSKLASAYRLNKYENDNEILQHVFTDLNNNAFYKLKNKLQREVFKSLLILHYGRDDINNILNQLLLARILIAKSDFNGAHKILANATKKANEVEVYDVLICIYNELLQLSQHNTSINVNEVLKAKSNIVNTFREIDLINDKIAKFTYQLRQINHQNSDVSILQELKIIEAEIEQNINLKNSSTLQLQLQMVVRNILLQQQDYETIVNYLKTKIIDFATRNIFNKGNFKHKITMQVWVINSLLILSKFEEAIDEAATLEQYLLENKKMYYPTFFWTLVQSKTIAYYYLNQPQKAISILEDTIKSIKKDDNSLYRHPIHFNLAVNYFSTKNYKKGHRYLNYLNDKGIEQSYNKDFLINSKVLDVLFYYELEDIEFGIYKLNQLKDRHKYLLNKPSYKMVKQFVSILKNLLIKTYISENLRKKCENFILKHHSVDANRGINYAFWLEAKLKKVDYYNYVLQNITSKNV